jgi:anaerobic magnesium-protoporphyrin IX monomethyl ester cyclase
MRDAGREGVVADVLLTHSYHLPFDRKQSRKMEPYPPLGTLYAAGLLRANGISVAVFDTMLQEPEAGFREALQRHRPSIVAIYEDDFNFLTKMCLTRMREVAWQMINTAQQFGARVVVHGSDSTDHAGDYLRRGCEYVLEGEAEYALLNVVRAMNCGEDVTSIPGVKWLKRNGSQDSVGCCSHRRARFVGKLPLPARDLIDLTLYRTAWKSTHRRFSMNIVGSRGCPFRCNWCAKPIFGDAFQLRPASEVADEMFLLKEAYGAEHLWFADDIFGLNRHWVDEFAECVEQRRAALPFKIQARADLITKATAESLRRAGCGEVWMGVESGSQKVLDAMEKGLRVEEVISAREHLKSEGIRACYFLQLGYPGEQWEDIQKTVVLVRETRPDDVGISFSYPLPNTRFYARVKEQLGAKQNWSDSEDLCVMFKGAYNDRLYRAVRDALHVEVENWNSGRNCGDGEELWRDIAALEPACRNRDATNLGEPPGHLDVCANRNSPFVFLHAETEIAGGAND